MHACVWGVYGGQLELLVIPKRSFNAVQILRAQHWQTSPEVR
jgi:hypothetical protein